MPLSFGQYLIRDHLPPELKLGGEPLNKKALKRAFLRMAKEEPEVYVQKIQGLKRTADEIASLEPISPGLEDIRPDRKARDKIVDRATREMDRATSLPLRLAAISRAQSDLLRLAERHPGSLAQEVRAGARGSVGQLAKTVVSPVVALRPDKSLFPEIIRHSYAEGLTPAEAWMANTEARTNMMATYLTVAEPGDLGKIFINNMADQVVSTEDCGTQNGVALPADSPEVRDRYLAKAAAGYSRGSLVSSDVARNLARTKGLVLVRSPSTCNLPQGVCQRCAGLNEVGEPHTIGTNLGVRAGHVLTQPLTQIALDSKHGGKTGERKGQELRGLGQLRQLVEVSSAFANRAVVAEEPGRVSQIRAAPQGGHNIQIGERAYYTPPTSPPIVRKGAHVEAGDSLSAGLPNPQDITRLRGLGEGRNYMVRQLHKLYSNAGHDIDRRHLELLAKSHLNYEIVQDPGQVPGLRAGDMVVHSALRDSLRDMAAPKPLDKAAGNVLGDDYLHHTAGSPVTPRMVADFREAGINRVNVLTPEQAPHLEFVMKPLSRNPLLNPDVLVRMGHRFLKAGLLEGVHMGRTSNLRGLNPIPALAHGASFGLPGPGGVY